MAPDGELIRAGEAARMLGVNRVTLYRWTRQGKIRYFEVGPHRERRFLREDVLKLLRERQAEGEGERE